MRSILFCFGILSSFHPSHAQEAKLILPIGITNYVNALRYSPDGKLILTGEDESVKIWDAASGKLLSEYKAPGGLSDAQFFPDSKRILVVTRKDTLRIIDAVSTRVLSVIKTGNDLEYAALSKDGKLILTVSWDSTARVWNTETKQKIMQVKMDDFTSGNLGFSPSGDKFYTVSYTSLQVWDIKTKTNLLRIKHANGQQFLDFSSDGMTIAASNNDTVKLWKSEPGKLVFQSQFPTGQYIIQIKICSDGKKIATASPSGIKVWNLADHYFLYELPHVLGDYGHSQSICFSPDGQKLLTISKDKANVWNANTGGFLFGLKALKELLEFQSFSPDGKRILAITWNTNAPGIWDARSGEKIASLAGHTGSISACDISKNGNTALLHFWDGNPKFFDSNTGALISQFDNALISPDRKKILLIAKDSVVELLNAETGKKEYSIKELRGNISVASFTRDTKKIMAAYTNGNIRIWDIESETMFANTFIPDSISYQLIDLSPDSSKFLAASTQEGIVKVCDIRSGKVLQTLLPADYTGVAQFSADGKTILTVTNTIFESIIIWDVKTGKPLNEFPAHETSFVNVSKDRKKALINSYDFPVEILDAGTGAFIRKLKYKYSDISNIDFSEDGKNVNVITNEGKLRVIDIQTGKETVKPPGSNRFANTEAITADGNYFIGISEHIQTIEKWDIKKNKLLYSFFPVDSTDYLITDGDNHYDGSDAARKLLYFTCGREIIDLDQVKDQLWVPNLGERIMKNDTLHARSLNELNLCGLTPEVEEADSKDGSFAFNIIPRRGGLGETVVYVNEIETKRYTPAQLVKTATGYQLLIKKEELAGYFIPGKENPVSVKAYTADNSISSRGFKISENKSKTDSLPTNLYAVMIGVSDYKGDELDLKFAAKDATDISSAIGNASRKLLDVDGQEHVYMYNMTTATSHYQLPEKNSIKKLFEDIGHKATANDILLVFFAGHGVMTGEGDKKQFYFLTADASQATAIAAVADVGISTAELTEWMKPQNIKAQKRVLIFDACNSGQAINDLVKIGGNAQGYTASRDDDKPRLQKAIDKLNEKSGLFILAASASDQDAYEMGRYSQGLLTYSLLKAIKEDPTILDEGKYLDLSRWFNVAEKTVSDISRENRARQEPQIISTTNFDIGIVDEEVIAKIILPEEKPIFAASVFLNKDEAINDDDLELSKMTNKALADISSRGIDNKIVYVNGTNLPDAYSLTGSYDVKGNTITVRVNIKQGKKIKQSFEIGGTKDKLEELAAAIVSKASTLIK